MQLLSSQVKVTVISEGDVSAFLMACSCSRAV
uniref:Uncharacterized protein n=1 Tax=Anguilla anguilla TaxID=7936 RepID=A0A0E9S0V0_ANGAN